MSLVHPKDDVGINETLVIALYELDEADGMLRRDYFCKRDISCSRSAITAMDSLVEVFRATLSNPSFNALLAFSMAQVEEFIMQLELSVNVNCKADPCCVTASYKFMPVIPGEEIDWLNCDCDYNDSQKHCSKKRLGDDKPCFRNAAHALLNFTCIVDNVYKDKLTKSVSSKLGGKFGSNIRAL